MFLYIWVVISVKIEVIEYNNGSCYPVEVEELVINWGITVEGATGIGGYFHKKALLGSSVTAVIGTHVFFI